MTCMELHVVLKSFEPLNTSLKQFGAAGHRLHAREPRKTHYLMFEARMLVRQGTQYMLLEPRNTLSKQSLRGSRRQSASVQFHRSRSKTPELRCQGQQIHCSIMVNISACHAEDPVSISGRGGFS
jgi:hypothetical protein